MSYSNKTHVILIRDEVQTEDVSLVRDDIHDQDYTLVYYKKKDGDRGKMYPYERDNVKVLTEPEIFNPATYTFYHKDSKLENLYIACRFTDKNKVYWVFSFLDHRKDIVCPSSEVKYEQVGKQTQKPADILSYLRTMGFFHGYDIRDGEGNVILGDQYDNLSKRPKESLLDTYLSPEGFINPKPPVTEHPIYPFGLNGSQLKAIKRALSNRVSIIQGPPGTGKTQTILNILANLVVNGKTALVVAGSNSATENVLEKLQKDDMGFIVAKLGNKANKKKFIDDQNKVSGPDISWNKCISRKRISALEEELKNLFDINVRYHQCIHDKKNAEADTLQRELESKQFKHKNDELRELSMDFFKGALYERYNGYKYGRYSDSSFDDKQSSEQLLQDFPIVLSTAYSARRSLHPEVLFDYVILDEASQIDVSTGALALACAKNVVIVGDNQQLPNVVKEEIKVVSNEIFKFFNIPDRYNYAEYSFLQSMLSAFPDAPQTLLREHYRCHPKIAEFFNKEFYGGKLVIMTEDHGENPVLVLRRTFPGYHAADRTNHREEQELEDMKNDHNLSENSSNIGIIAPYNNQVNRIDNDEDIEDDILVSTVHKFQGREKDIIIVSTVDNVYSAFVNDPHLLNVTVSRAKKMLMVVTNGNPGNDGHVAHLVKYIEEHGRVEQPEVKSLFDLTYDMYEKERIDFFAEHGLIPQKYLNPNDKEKPSLAEQIAYGFICDVFRELNTGLTFKFRSPLRGYVTEGKESQLTADEKCYIEPDKDTHVDFMICEGSKPILAIEIDGSSYHIDGSPQDKNDRMKDRILEEVCGIKILRLRTKESISERTVLSNFLKDILYN